MLCRHCPRIKTDLTDQNEFLIRVIRVYPWPTSESYGTLLLITLALQFPQEPSNRIVEVVNHALLQRNNRVVGYMDVFWTDFSTTLRDIAEADPKLVFQQLSARHIVKWMHL